jgi:hypothetical protein
MTWISQQISPNKAMIAFEQNYLSIVSRQDNFMGKK